MCLYAPESAKDFEEYEKIMRELTKVILEGRKEGARRLFAASELHIELGFLCMDQDEEMKGFFRTAVLVRN